MVTAARSRVCKNLLISVNSVYLPIFCGTRAFNSVNLPSDPLFSREEECTWNSKQRACAQKSLLELEESENQIKLVISKNHNGKLEDIVQSLQCDQACGNIQLSEAFTSNMLHKCGDDWKSALAFFQWSSSISGYKHSIYAYNKMVDILGKMRQMEKMWALVGEMCMTGFVNLETVAKIMRRLAGAGKWKDAIETFNNLECMGLSKDIDTLNTLLDTLCKEKQVQPARDIFLEVKSQIPPNAYTFNIFVHGWCKLGKIDEAEWTIQEMKGYGIQPSVITYSTIIQAYCNQRNIVKVYELLDRMQDDGCPPNIITYTGIMHSFVRFGNTEAAFQVEQRMRSSGCKPDVIYYNSLLNMLGRAGQLSEVARIYDTEMHGNGISPNLSTYNTLISVYCHHSLEEKALLVLKEMELSGCKPDLVTYVPLLKLFLKSGKIDDRLQIMLNDIVNKHNLSLDSATYSLLIHGLCRAGKFEWALLLFDEMIDREIPPRKRTFTLLLNEADERGLYRTVDRLKDIMK